MSRESVNICDDCKDVVAHYKCRFCGKDLCSYHATNFTITFNRVDYQSKDPPTSIKMEFYNYRDDKNKDKCICNKCSITVRNSFDIIERAIGKDKSLNIDISDKIIKLLKEFAKVEVI